MRLILTDGTEKGPQDGLTPTVCHTSRNQKPMSLVCLFTGITVTLSLEMRTDSRFDHTQVSCSWILNGMIYISLI